MTSRLFTIIKAINSNHQNFLKHRKKLTQKYTFAAGSLEEKKYAITATKYDKESKQRFISCKLQVQTIYTNDACFFFSPLGNSV